MIELTGRERAVLVVALAVGLVLGLWAGLLLLPAEALNVPTEQRETGLEGQTSERAVFLPVPRSYFAVTIGAPALAVWYSYTRLRGEQGPTEATDQDVHEAVTDGGERRG